MFSATKFWVVYDAAIDNWYIYRRSLFIECLSLHLPRGHFPFVIVKYLSTDCLYLVVPSLRAPALGGESPAISLCQSATSLLRMLPSTGRSALPSPSSTLLLAVWTSWCSVLGREDQEAHERWQSTRQKETAQSLDALLGPPHQPWWRGCGDGGAVWDPLEAASVRWCWERVGQGSPFKDM